MIIEPAENKSFFLLCSLYGMSPKGLAQICGGSSDFNRSGLKLDLPTSNYVIKKSITRVPYLGFSYLQIQSHLQPRIAITTYTLL